MPSRSPSSPTSPSTRAAGNVAPAAATGTGLSRRSFLLNTVLAAAAAPWLVPAGVVRAQDGRPTPSNRTTFALIGCGNMGPAGLNEMLRCKDAQVIATCDVFKSRAERHRDRVNRHYKNTGATAYQDFRELLARRDLDCVEIATGDYWHVPLALAAIRAGKDTYVEKPLGVSVRWAQKLVTEINRRKAVFQFGTWQRARPHFRRVCEIVRSGLLGKISRVEAWAYSLKLMDNRSLGNIYDPKSKIRALHLDKATPPPPADLNYDLWLGPAPKHPFNPVRVSPQGIYHNYDYALGFLAGWGIHPLDIAQWGLDADLAPPVSYEAKGDLPDVPGLFNTIATWDVHATYANGVKLRFMDTSVANGADAAAASLGKGKVNGEGTTFFGENGKWVHVNRGGAKSNDPEISKLIKVKRTGGGWPPSGGDTPAAIAKDAKYVTLQAAENGSHWHNFIARVRDRKPTLNPIESAFSGDLVCHLADIAIRQGRPVKWDAATGTIAGDPASNALLDRPLRKPWKL